MNPTSKISVLLCVTLAALSWSCSNRSNDARQTLAVSLDPERQLLEALAGDDYDIITVLENGANPETFEPSMSRRLSVDRCKAYFKNGALPFEDAILNTLSDDVTVVDLSKGITPLYGTHSHHSHNDDDAHHHDDGNGYDPHIWTSVKNARIIAANMAEALISLNPAQTETINKRLAVLDQKLDSIDSSIQTRIDKSGAKKFLIWHPSLSYFARDYGLTQISIGQESKEVPLGQLKEIIDIARRDSIDVFFFQKEYDSRQAETISRELGIEYQSINLLTHDWIGQLNNITDAITR